METADLTHHISRRFNEDLEKVRNQVLQMGGFVEQQLHKAILALVEGDSRLGESVATEDYKVNGMEVSIDEECSRILAIRAPAAGDLRVIVAIIKTITDLERIGDEGEKIGYIASRLATMERPADKYREVKHLGRQVAQMVHDALDAFARMDSQAALKTAQEDKMVDEEYESIQRQCITFMMEDPRTIRRALEIMWIVRALERIGDHAKNICEYVIYMVHGKDIRHTSLEDVAKQIDAAQALRAADDAHAARIFSGCWPAQRCWRMPITRSSSCIWSPVLCASFSASACWRSGSRSRSRPRTIPPVGRAGCTPGCSRLRRLQPSGSRCGNCTFRACRPAASQHVGHRSSSCSRCFRSPMCSLKCSPVRVNAPRWTGGFWGWRCRRGCSSPHFV